MNRWLLLPRLVEQGAGLVTLWNDRKASIALNRTVFEANAPDLIAAIEKSIGGPIKQGGSAPRWDEQTLSLLTEAYRRAAGKLPSGP